MKRTIKLNESELHRIIKESVKKIINESFMDDIKTNAAYVKNKIRDYMPPMSGVDTTDRVINACKWHIQKMEDYLQSQQKCPSKFMHTYDTYMRSAKENGYTKYYNKMKELRDQMTEQVIE